MDRRSSIPTGTRRAKMRVPVPHGMSESDASATELLEHFAQSFPENQDAGGLQMLVNSVQDSSPKKNLTLCRLLSSERLEQLQRQTELAGSEFFRGLAHMARVEHCCDVVQVQMVQLWFEIDSFVSDLLNFNLSCKSEAVPYVASISDKWRLVDLFLEYKGLVTQHIDSYNHFVNVKMKKIVKAASNNIVRSESDKNWFLQYENIRVGRPSKTEDMIVQETNPHMCRLRDLTYAAPILVDVVYWKGDRKVRKRDLEIGMLPVMLRSNLCALSNAKTDEDVIALGECPMDPGGYFIVKGVERVLMMQEQSLTNRIVVEYDSKKLLQAFVTSSSDDTKSRTVVVANPLTRKKGLYMKNSAFSDLIPISIVMKAMGVQSDMEIIQMVGIQRKYLDTLMISLQECHEKNVFSQKAALDYLSTKIKVKPGQERRQKQDPMDLIHRQVLSHIECPNNNLGPKIRYFGLMIRRVINAMYDGRLVDDRDYYGNKRLELSGQLIEVLFEDQFKFMNMELQKQADLLLSKWHQSSAARVKDMSSYPDILESWQDRSKLTRAMANAISTGNWNIKRFRIDRAGVSQVLSRFSYMSCVGSMMRVKSQFEKSRKVAGPRALQPSQWGMICPADTPEGEQCGLVKHLDAQAMSGEELHHIGNYLAPRKHFDDPLATQSSLGIDRVFLNGSLLGIHRRPKRFMASLQQLRRRGLIGEFVSIYEDEGWHAIFVASDGGRLCRPLIIVADCKSRFIPEKHVPLMLKAKADGGMKFDDFLKQGVLEWVDVNEENNLFIALQPDEITPETTHLEIEPFTLLGVVSGLIPYPNHNQSPRNTYECAMGKQAMGCIAMNQFTRSDTLLLGLVYPEKPLCTSKTLNLVNFHQLGAGQNASVAVMSYSGYDIEDAIIMNRAALDRGFGRCFVMRRQGVLASAFLRGFFCQVQMTTHGNGTTDLLAPPQPAGKNAKLSSLDEDGMVRPSEKVEDGFLLANKISPVETKALQDLSTVDIKYKATPVHYKNPVSSYIDRVLLTTDAEGMKVYKIITRQTRRPEVGDKFASRHGQKGVIGLIVPEQDLPFSETGWRPDLIMNPHGFPSRMTVGKMLELIGSKAAVLEGMFANGSAFGGTPAHEIYRTLISHGFAPTGKEYLTSGITGEPIESYIFCGPIYYQKLKHMVVDKMHARARGPRMLLTRQPTEGRAKEGGLRLGEMERDCLVAYGASNLLLERLMLSSDVCNPNVCRKCGLFCRPDWCKLCSSAEWVTSIRLPYACKLLFQEMQAMNAPWILLFEPFSCLLFKE
ncbi:rpc2 [Symbiodinium natans]|uniref:DNA-directed RNA polymerase subunit beta n=1 Tax=Symbiodinium natans TaxID=878477 RepID=A0A812JW35_9DINO|nr:rpc2 [Symbiodinium natans]